MQYAACRAVSVHLYFPPSKLEAVRQFQKKQMGSSHKAPARFVKGMGGIKKREKRENTFPIVEGEVSGDLLVLM